jgi:Flp pilus assembly protein TadG
VFHDRSGSALIEAAVAAPALLLMVFGILQFGNVMHQNIMLNDAVRVGSRSLAVARGSSNPCSTAATKIQNAATGLSLANLSITITVNGNTYGPAANPSCAGVGTSMSTGGDATARATYPCSVIIYGTNFIPGCTLSATTTVRVE